MGANQPKAPLNIPDSLGTSGWRKEIAIKVPHQIFFVVVVPPKEIEVLLPWGGMGRGEGEPEKCLATTLPPVQIPLVAATILPDLRNIRFCCVKVIVIAIIPGSCLPLCLITVQHNNHYSYH